MPPDSLRRGAYFHFIPGQITFAYTAPPTRLLANGENMTHHVAQARAEAIWLAVNVNKYAKENASCSKPMEL